MDRNRPLIGITAYEVPASFSHWRDMPAVMVPAAYSQSVVAAGGLPVVIPPVEDPADLLDQLQGLVLSGGSDLDAGLYGEQQHPETLGVIAHRDRSELELLAAALDRDLPVLGICRGMQLLNVQRGGSLHQHLPEIVDGSLHKAAPGTFALHRVAIEPGSRLEALLGPARRCTRAIIRLPTGSARGWPSRHGRRTAWWRGSSSAARGSASACCGTRRSTPSTAVRCSRGWWPRPSRPPSNPAAPPGSPRSARPARHPS